MLNFDLDKMLFVIPPKEHDKYSIKRILKAHPEVWYVSFVGIDIGGHDTDEKIPVSLFLSQLDDMLENGVQTDGSSVALPKIAVLNNAKVSIIPDIDCKWYVDYNYRNIDYKTGLPVGTLRIPSYLIHDDRFPCGSRVILKEATRYVEKELIRQLEENPYVFKHLNGISGVDEIERLCFTSATELEFWVRTPEDKGDREQLFTSQVLKEQYWKRTFAEVRTALEDTLKLLDAYGFGVEMGHKEVGGVKPHMSNSGHYDHVMEQLEIDWLYADAVQAADNENQVKYIVRDIFTMHGLDVTFMAKPIAGVAGSGKHTHMGLAADLKSGKRVNLFSPSDMKKDYLSPIGFGALMGLLKHYEVISPFVSSSNDAMNRLKPGYEAPVCIVTSLGRSPDEPSRNRTVLTGLIRDLKKPLATRFELRAPNPKSNSYLVLAASWMAMADGIKYALENRKSPEELEKSISKSYGEEDPYLETYREYRSEKEIYEDYSDEEREKLFGKAPATIWENIAAFDRYPDKLKVMKRGGVMPDIALESYKAQVLSHWKTELHDRLIPEKMSMIRGFKKADMEAESDLDRTRWKEIDRLRHDLGKESLDHVSLLKKTKDALDRGDLEEASNLQVKVQERMTKLVDLYSEYRKNIL
jgi:glutamine synthetase